MSRIAILVTILYVNIIVKFIFVHYLIANELLSFGLKPLLSLAEFKFYPIMNVKIINMAAQDITILIFYENFVQN